MTAALVVAAFLSGLGLGNLFSARISYRLSPRFSFRILVLLELSRQNLAGSFMDNFVVQSVVPGFFMIACAVYAVGLGRFTVKNPIDLAMLALAGACLYFFAGLDGSHFPPAAAALAFAIRYRGQPGNTTKSASARLLLLCLITIAAWLLVSALDNRWWDLFHYFVGMYWIAYSHGEGRSFSWRDPESLRWEKGRRRRRWGHEESPPPRSRPAISH